MRTRADLYPYQRESAAKMVAAKQLACFLDPGLGKTAATLTALKDMGSPPTLILAPAKVAETVWHAESRRWEHTRDMDIRPCVGTPARRLYLLNNTESITLSYENLAWLLSTVDLPRRFGAIVFDELSKMKAPGTTRFRRMRAPIRQIPIRIGLTGTPVGNHLLDIWGEMYMVADEKPLGPTFGEFQQKYFDPTHRVNNIPVGWKARHGAQREIEKRIAPWAFTLQTTDAPQLAGLKTNIIRVSLPEHVQQQANALASELTVRLDSGADLYAFSATTAAMKVRQMVGGAVYVEGERWEPVHGSKMQALEDLVSELQGEPLLVGYWFKHEAERLMSHFKGKARMLTGARDIDAWNRGEVEMLLVHPASAGHGINLQHGGHTLCWYTLPWSLEMLKQTRGRLIRHGQKSPYVMEHVLSAGEMDEKVLSALDRKNTVESELLSALLG